MTRLGLRPSDIDPRDAAVVVDILKHSTTGLSPLQIMEGTPEAAFTALLAVGSLQERIGELTDDQRDDLRQRGIIGQSNE